jgi:S1-C subfamily serine protease
LVDAQGDVVTNAHVIADGGPYMIQLGTSAVAKRATLLGEFPPDDLAVLRITGAKNLKPAKIGGAGALRVGDWVLAIGNPLGLTNTVTVGVVSALGREVSEPATPSAPSAVLPDSIQTSAAINPGNSGGALVNLAGQVVGITTLGASGTLNSGAVITGIGFAIPSTIVNDITGQIIRYGRVINSHRADLGLSGSSITNAEGAPIGVAVEAVTPGGPAAQAGILVGDLITAVAGKPTPTTERLAEVLADQQPGKRVRVELTDGTGSARTVSVVLGTLAS